MARIELPTVRSTKALRVMAVIVIDAILSARRDPARRISYSRRNGWWHETRRYRAPEFTYYTVVPAIDVLVKAGILIDHDLQPPGRATGTQSSYRPAPCLADVTLPVLRHEVFELVRFKDADGKLVEYRDTDRTRAERLFMSKINRSIAEADIALVCPDAKSEGGLIRTGKQVINLAQMSLYQVFNGAWNLGGRYYGGWWQSCPKHLRKHITIDGQPTVELDFSQIHPRLLYTIAGRHLEGDAYVIPGWKRADGKEAFNTMLNATTLKKARGALAAYFGGDTQAASRIIDDVKAHHDPIRDYFHSGVGLRLQNIDAGICHDILAEMRRHCVVTLPIHDSFIVPAEAEDLLSDVMNRAWGKALRNVSSAIALIDCGNPTILGRGEAA